MSLQARRSLTANCSQANTTSFLTSASWALTTDSKRIIMDDGTPQLRFRDQETFKETGRFTVTDQGQPSRTSMNLNG
jgi:glutamine cyclotransferase